MLPIILIGVFGAISLIGTSLIVYQLQVAILGKEYEAAHQNNWNDGTVQGQVWGYLKAKGLPDIQVAAIMGNIQRESGFNPNVIEAGSGYGYGLCQWSFGRRTQLENYAIDTKKSLSAVGTQLDFFWQEFSPVADHTHGTYQWISSLYSYEGFMGAPTIEEATAIFCHGWERCATDESKSALQSIRIPWAQTYYNKYRGSTGGSGGGQGIVATALSQAGNVGGQPYWSWYGFSGRVEWCACFVSWCADQNGLIASGQIPKFSYCPTGVAWFQNKGQWSGTPAAGYIIFFDWDTDGVSDHVGIVESVADGYVHTIEGNGGNDDWHQGTYPQSYQCILGYGTY